jgi:hypothetical protein
MKKLVFTLLAVFLVLQLVSAIDTEISGKTLPYATVQISVIKQAGSEVSVLQMFKADADQYGDFKFLYSSSEKSFYINSYVKWDGETIFSKRFTESFTAGEPISLTLAADDAILVETPGATTVKIQNSTNTTRPITNQTTNSTNQTTTAPPVASQPSASPPAQVTAPAPTNPTKNTNAPVTGNVLSDTQKTSFPITYAYYILGAIVIVGILFFIFRAKGRHSSSNFNFRPATKGEASHVMQLERKLQDAEKEIHILKNQGKIKSVEQRIAEERRELERLKRGEA